MRKDALNVSLQKRTAELSLAVLFCYYMYDLCQICFPNLI